MVKVRLFTAFHVPMEPLSNVLQELGYLREVKTVNKDSLHVTIIFIGEVEDGIVPMLKERLSSLHMKPVKLELNSVGAFPSQSNPRVIWVGLRGDINPLHQLRKEQEQILREMRIPFDSKPFSPHVTIGRVKERPSKGIPQFIERYVETKFGEFIVQGFRLMKSTLTPQGPIYETLLEVEAR